MLQHLQQRERRDVNLLRCVHLRRVAHRRALPAATLHALHHLMDALHGCYYLNRTRRGRVDLAVGRCFASRYQPEV